jgi:hypothetical protein
MSFINDQPADENWNIVIESSLIAEALANDPAFIAAITKAVRDQMTKDVRKMGNLYGNKAQLQLNNQTKPPTLNANQTKRVQ